MDWEGEYLGERRFFELVDLGGLPPNGNLEGASGLRASEGPYETSLIRDGETAWRTPYPELTCTQVATLIQQRMGLQWLGRPAIAFARKYPCAAIALYPGELALDCLKAADELAVVAQPEFSEWMEGDFSWIETAFGWSRHMLREATETLSAARMVASRPALATRRKSSHMRRGSRADGALANPVRSGRKQP